MVLPDTAPAIKEHSSPAVQEQLPAKVFLSERDSIVAERYLQRLFSRLGIRKRENEAEGEAKVNSTSEQTVSSEELEVVFDSMVSIVELMDELKDRNAILNENAQKFPILSIEERQALISQGKIDQVRASMAPSASQEFTLALDRKRQKLRDELDAKINAKKAILPAVKEQVKEEVIVRRLAREVQKLNSFVVDVLRLIRELKTQPKSEAANVQGVATQQLREYQQLIQASRERINVLLANSKVLARYERMMQIKVNEPELARQQAAAPVTKVSEQNVNVAQASVDTTASVQRPGLPSTSASSAELSADEQAYYKKEAYELSVQQAKEILKDNYIGPEGLKLLEAQYQTLNIDVGFPIAEGEIPPVPFSKVALEYARDHNMVLVYRPHRMNIGDRITTPKNFQDFQEMLHQSEQLNGVMVMIDTANSVDNISIGPSVDFKQENKYHSGWVLVPKVPPPEMMNSSWNEQQLLLSKITSVLGGKQLASLRSATETLMDLQILAARFGLTAVNGVMLTGSFDEKGNPYVVGYQGPAGKDPGVDVFPMSRERKATDMTASHQILPVGS